LAFVEEHKQARAAASIQPVQKSLLKNGFGIRAWTGNRRGY
jgi:hypothetical protein